MLRSLQYPTMDRLLVNRGATAARKYRKPELLSKDRSIIFFTNVTTLHANAMVVPHGYWSNLSEIFPVSAKCVARHWKEMQAQYEINYGPIQDINIVSMMSNPPHDVFETKKKATAFNNGKYNKEELAKATANIPKSKRQSVRNTAAQLGISATTFH